MRAMTTLSATAKIAVLCTLFACSGDDSAGQSESGETTDATATATDSNSNSGDVTGTTGATGEDPSTGEDSSTSSSGGDSTGEGALCSELACEDALVLDLSLQESVAETDVSSIVDGEDWLASVDASAGGSAGAATNPWLYMRFTDTGLEKVDIDDFAALTSSQWHIAAKRFGVRVNSGSSGPGCVEVALAGDVYSEVDSAPDSGFAEESFYDGSCALIVDGSGIGGPNYAMTSWWGYNGCVTTSEQVFAVALDDQRVVKLVIEAYYAEGQEGCNESGAMGTGSAEMTWRWRFLD